MKKGVRCLVVLVMVIVLCAQVQVSVFAAGTNKNSATEVVADNQINYGTISKGGVNDWYYITTGESEEYYYFTLHNESGTENIHMIVYSARDEQLLDVGYYTSAGSEITSNIKLLPNAKYYLKVYFNDQGTGNYYFKIDKKIDLVGDSKEKANEIKINEKIDSSMSINVFAANESESNDSKDNATAIAVNSITYGNLSKSNDVDWYSLEGIVI